MRHTSDAPSINKATTNDKLTQEWLDMWIVALSSSRSRLCSFEADKVLSTFGMANLTCPRNITESIFSEVDATDTVKVFLWMSTFLIQQSNSLDALSMVGPNSFHKTRQMPSWTIDFSESILWIPLTQMSQFDASLMKNAGRCDRMFISKGILNVSGLHVCKINEVGPAVGGYRIPWHLFRYLSRSPFKYHHTGQTPAEVFRGALILDHPGFLNLTDAEYSEAFHDWLESAIVMMYLFPPLRLPLSTAEGCDLVDSAFVWLFSVVGALKEKSGLIVGWKKVRRTSEKIQKDPNWPTVSQEIGADFADWNIREDSSAKLSIKCESIPDFGAIVTQYLFSPFYRAMRNTLSGRTDFYADNDCFGLCHRSCKQDDEV